MDPVMNTSDVLASSLDSLATSMACGSTSMLEDTVASSLMLTSHGVASSLGISQANLGLNDMDAEEHDPEGMPMGASRLEHHSLLGCGGDLDHQPMGGEGEEEGGTTDMSSLGLPQSSLMLVNIPNANQTSLATATLMPILVLSTGNGMQKGSSVDTSGIMLDRPQQDLRQLLRLRDLAHANLICATQESIAKSFGVNNQPSEEKLFKCEECGRSFKSSSHYRYHCETHKGNKVLKCPVDGCNRHFAWPAHLKYHTRTHANDRPYTCTEIGCGKTFYTVQSRHVHMRTHTGLKPFKCPEEDCGKSFTTAGNLKNHSRIHTGERPFLCDHDGCIQSFAEHSSLRKHKLTHTGEKPYECEICLKVFSQCGSRNTHKRRHHSISKMQTTTSNGSDKKTRQSLKEMVSLPQENKNRVDLSNDSLLENHQNTTQQGLTVTLANTDHASPSLQSMSNAVLTQADMRMSSHSSVHVPGHDDGISLHVAHSVLGDVTLDNHEQATRASHSIQTEDQDGDITMLSHGSMTLSHSILQVAAELDQSTGCKSDPSDAPSSMSNQGNVVVLSEPNHTHTSHTLSMMTDPGQFPVSHQPSSADDMVYNNAMLQSAASMVDQDHTGSDVGMSVPVMEVGNDPHHHDLHGSDIVITW